MVSKQISTVFIMVLLSIAVTNGLPYYGASWEAAEDDSFVREREFDNQLWKRVFLSERAGPCPSAYSPTTFKGIPTCTCIFLADKKIINGQDVVVPVNNYNAVGYVGPDGKPVLENKGGNCGRSCPTGSGISSIHRGDTLFTATIGGVGYAFRGCDTKSR